LHNLKKNRIRQREKFCYILLLCGYKKKSDKCSLDHVYCT